jgi:hypothetical protein
VYHGYKVTYILSKYYHKTNIIQTKENHSVLISPDLGGSHDGRGIMYGCEIRKYHSIYPGAAYHGYKERSPLCSAVKTQSMYWVYCREICGRGVSGTAE